MQIRAMIGVGVVVLALLPMTRLRCTKPREENTAPIVVSTPAQTAASDAKLLEAIKAKFAEDPILKKETIQMVVKDGQVTLTGTVSTGEARIKAEDVARNASPDIFAVDTDRLLAK